MSVINIHRNIEINDTMHLSDYSESTVLLQVDILLLLLLLLILFIDTEVICGTIAPCVAWPCPPLRATCATIVPL